jgi:hypothetical protein
VRARASARIPEFRNARTLPHTLALVNQVAAIVSVNGQDARPVLDNDQITIAALPIIAVDDSPSRSCIDRCTGFVG